jgi:magnesium chelatase family protein
VPAEPAAQLAVMDRAESSLQIRDRVQEARERQLHRFRGTGVFANAQLGARDLRRFCAVDVAGERRLAEAVRRLGLSARAYYRVLRLARTIADLAGAAEIAGDHVLEAITYRNIDRTMSRISGYSGA